MPLAYSYLEDEGMLVISGSGQVSLADRRACVHQVLADGTLPRHFPILINVSGVHEGPPAMEMHRVSGLVDELQARGGSRVAIVNNTLGHVTISHLIALSTTQSVTEVRAFASDEFALAWLREPVRA